MLTVQKKAIFSFSTLELYEYPLIHKSNNSFLSNNIINIKIQKPYSPQIGYIKSSNRAKTQIRRLISSNLDFSVFYTLTFASNVTDIKTANNLFNQFIKRLNTYLNSKNLKSCKYMAIPEFQKRGAVHYHLLLNNPYITQTVINKLWQHGFTKIKTIYNQKFMAFYFMKYFSKSDIRMYKKKRFFTSQNLLKPLILYGLDIDLYFTILFERLKLYYKTEFYNKFIGTIKYYSFYIEPLV
jgi:hypothetical protein